MLDAFLFSVLFNLFFFLLAYSFKTDKFTDISYSLTFIAIVSYLFFKNAGADNIVSTLVYFMVCLWAVRLGSYLLYRIYNMGRDKRFDSMRNEFFKFIRFWLLQGITVPIILIPSIFLLEQNNMQFSKLSIAGIILFLFGVIYETIADIQKFTFVSKNKGKLIFIQNGVWKYSRHPNYFGEICVWLGIYFYCYSYLSIEQKIIALISPIFIFVLLRFVSGIPLLEKANDKKFANNAEYEKYKKVTPRLFPKLW